MDTHAVDHSHDKNPLDFFGGMINDWFGGHHEDSTDQICSAQGNPITENVKDDSSGSPTMRMPDNFESAEHLATFKDKIAAIQNDGTSCGTGDDSNKKDDIKELLDFGSTLFGTYVNNVLGTSLGDVFQAALPGWGNDDFVCNEWTNAVAFKKMQESTADVVKHELCRWTPDDVETIVVASEKGRITSDHVVKALWTGVPDKFKGEIFGAISGATFFCNKKPDTYVKAFNATFQAKGVLQENSGCPTFCPDKSKLDQCVPFLHLLNPAGLRAARRILCCVAYTHPEVTCCPPIPVLVCMLLVFFTEEAKVFAAITTLLRRAERRAKQGGINLLPRTDEQWQLFIDEAHGRMDSELEHLEFEHLETLGVDIRIFLQEWLYDGLASKLPFRGMCRIYGVFLAEGACVFWQFLLALFLSQRKVIMTCHTPVAAELLLKSLAEDVVELGMLDGQDDGLISIDLLSVRALKYRIAVERLPDGSQLPGPQLAHDRWKKSKAQPGESLGQIREGEEDEEEPDDHLEKMNQMHETIKSMR